MATSKQAQSQGTGVLCCRMPRLFSLLSSAAAGRHGNEQQQQQQRRQQQQLQQQWGEPHLASGDRFHESRAGTDLLSPVAATFTLQYFLASVGGRHN